MWNETDTLLPCISCTVRHTRDAALVPSQKKNAVSTQTPELHFLLRLIVLRLIVLELDVFVLVNANFDWDDQPIAPYAYLRYPP
jgi:hypothetical protein